MDGNYEVMSKHRVFRYVLVYAANGQFLLLLNRKHFPDRIFITKCFMRKTFRHKNTSGHNHVFRISFQHGDAESLEKTSIRIDIIYVGQKFVFLIDISSAKRKDTTGYLNFFRHFLCQSRCYRIENGIVIIGSTLITCRFACVEVGYLTTHESQTFRVRIALFKI